MVKSRFKRESLRMNFRTLDLNLLRVFEAVMQEGNVRRAAEQLALTQSGVSNALARLRDAFNDELFEKTSAGVRPTATARELWQDMQPHFQGLRDALTPMVVDPSSFDACVRIAMSDYTARRVLPRLCAALSQQAPNLRLDVHPYNRADVLGMLDKHGVSMVLGSYINDEAVVEGLRMRALWTVRWSLFMRADHHLAKRPFTLEEFLQARHIDVTSPGLVMPGFDQLLDSQGLRRRLVLTLNAWEQALSVIAASDCVAVLPSSLLDGSPYADRIVEMESPIVMPPRTLWLLWHQREENAVVQRWLRCLIVELFSEPAPVSD